MLDRPSPTLADCSCPLCRRAAALDAMRLIDAARASASRVKPWPDESRGVTAGFALSGLAWLALLVAACWLMARLS